MTSKRPAVPTVSKPSWTEPVRPLGAADLAMVQGVMADIAPQWFVELHGFCADEATLVMVPEDGDDRTGPSFLISRESGGVRLDQVRWDTLTEVGLFPTLRDALMAVAPRLAFSGFAAMPASSTIH
jgi:hypothetical protein